MKRMNPSSIMNWSCLIREVIKSDQIILQFVFLGRKKGLWKSRKHDLSMWRTRKYSHCCHKIVKYRYLVITTHCTVPRLFCNKDWRLKGNRILICKREIIKAMRGNISQGIPDNLGILDKEFWQLALLTSKYKSKKNHGKITCHNP